MRLGWAACAVALWIASSLQAAPCPVSRAWAEDAEGTSPRDHLDAERRALLLERPGRERSARPDAVLAALRLEAGQVVGDVGTGTGYFARRFARAVGPKGTVYAVDIEPYLLDEARRRAEEEGLANIVPILTGPEDSGLPEDSCDWIFLSHVYIHIADGVPYLEHLRTRLKPSGRIAVIGWEKGRYQPGLGPEDDRRLSGDQIAADLRAAGFEILEKLQVLPGKHFLIASPRP
ncbi:MAG: class I SAM-dependent methyltransferase [Thermodesulfobacteriota bacterium]